MAPPSIQGDRAQRWHVRLFQNSPFLLRPLREFQHSYSLLHVLQHTSVWWDTMWSLHCLPKVGKAINLDRGPSLCLCLRLCLSFFFKKQSFKEAPCICLRFLHTCINVVTSNECSEKDQVVLKYDEFQEWPSVEQS